MDKAALASGNQRVLYLLGVAILMLGVLGPMHFLPIPSTYFRLSLLLILLPLLLLLAARNRGELTLNFQPLQLALWLMFVAALITLSQAIDSYGSLLGLLKWFAVLMLAQLTFNLVHDHREAVKLLVWAVFLAGAYVALIGVIQYLFGTDFYVSRLNQYPWPASTFGHKNMAAQFVVIAFPMAFYLDRQSLSRYVQLVIRLLAAIMLAYMVYARARQIYVALIIELVLVAWFYKWLSVQVDGREEKKGLPLWSWVPVAGLLLGLLLTSPFNQETGWNESALNVVVDRTVDEVEKSKNLQQLTNNRWPVWDTSIGMTKDHWSGVGLNNWKVHFPEYFVKSDHYQSWGNQLWDEAHNDYLQLGIELGIWFIAVIILFLWGLVRCTSVVQKHGSNNERQLFTAVIAGLAGLAVVMFFSFPLTKTAQPALLGVYIGILSVISPGKSGRLVVRWRYSKVMLLLFLAVVLILAFFSYRSVSAVASMHASKQIMHMVFLDESQASEEIRISWRERIAGLTDAAAKSDPFNPYVHRNLLVNYINLAATAFSDTEKNHYLKSAAKSALTVQAANPNIPQVNLSLGSAVGLPFKMARPYLERAVFLDRSNARYVLQLGWALRLQGEMESSLSVYEDFLADFFDLEVLQHYVSLIRQEDQLSRGQKVIVAIQLGKHLREGSAEYQRAEEEIQLSLRLLDGSAPHASGR